jgi:hypothetical protein
MSTKREKIEKAFYQAINNLERETSSLRRPEFIASYQDAIFQLKSARGFVSNMQNSQQQLIKKNIALKNASLRFIDLGIELEKILPKAKQMLQLEGDTFNKSLDSNNWTHTDASKAFFKGSESLLIRNDSLQLETIKPIVNSTTASLEIGKNYIELSNLMLNFYVRVVLGSEKSVKLKGKAKNVVVLEPEF